MQGLPDVNTNVLNKKITRRYIMVRNKIKLQYMPFKNTAKAIDFNGNAVCYELYSV